MDKARLYYIVRNGTNQRALNIDKTPYIVDAETIGEVMSDYPCITSEHVKITIEEYEQKFKDEKEDE